MQFRPEPQRLRNTKTYIPVVTLVQIFLNSEVVLIVQGASVDIVLDVAVFVLVLLFFL